MACSALIKEGVKVHGFIDNTNGGKNRTVAGLPAYTLNYHQAKQFFTELGHSFIFFVCWCP